MSAVPNFI